MPPGLAVFFEPFFDSFAAEAVSLPVARGCPHFQQRGGGAATASRSADTKFWAAHAAHKAIIGAILPCLPAV